ncbi:MAG: FAD-dependent oxidoreductase, partial [Candidatus Glassbacteria bacterium]|nr:FAD-dependent oxidoreductase [Candidatus Glassbacteria bacterium]
TFGSQVTVVEILPQILPLEDEELTAELARLYRRKGMRLLTGSRVEGVAVDAGRGCTVRVSSGEEVEEIACDLVLVAVGVAGNVEGIGLEEAGVEVEKGFIKVRPDYATTAQGIRAIGDCIGPPLLAHAASREAALAVEALLGHQVQPLDPDLVPGCTYCQPQLARVGLTEAQARQAGREITVGRFPFRPLGKALANGEPEGMVKAVVDKEDGKILGVHILGAEAVELIPEATLAMTLEAGAVSLESTVHPHPSLSEAVMEAAAAALGRAIHI